MYRPLLSYLLLATVILLSSCSLLTGDEPEADFGTYAFTAYDSTGVPYVRGTLYLNGREGPSSTNIEITLEGTWEMTRLQEGANFGPQFGPNRLIGAVREGSEVSINLHRDINDANVYLRGRFEGERFERMQGEWALAGWGVFNEGRFEAERR